MSGVSLNSLDIASVQFQLIGDTGVAETVEDYLRKTMFLDQLVQRGFDRGRFNR